MREGSTEYVSRKVDQTGLQGTALCCSHCSTSPSKINAIECNQMPCRLVTELSSLSSLEPKGDFPFHSHKPWTMLEMSVHAFCPAAAHQGSHGRRWSHGQWWGSCPREHPREKAVTVWAHSVLKNIWAGYMSFQIYIFLCKRGWKILFRRAEPNLFE